LIQFKNWHKKSPHAPILLYDILVIQHKLIMATWQAEILLNNPGNYFTVTVEGGSVGEAKGNIQHIYSPMNIRNLRQIRGSGSGDGISMPSGGGTWFVGLLGVAALFLYFTPWVLMLIYGSGGTWLAQKFTGVTVSDFADNEDPTEDEVKKGAIIMASAILLGGAGFIHGTIWNSELNKEYNLDGKQSQVEQVRQK
jgi:hypothetical protein